MQLLSSFILKGKLQIVLNIRLQKEELLLPKQGYAISVECANVV